MRCTKRLFPEKSKHISMVFDIWNVLLFRRISVCRIERAGCLFRNLAL